MTMTMTMTGLAGVRCGWAEAEAWSEPTNGGRERMCGTLANHKTTEAKKMFFKSS